MSVLEGAVDSILTTEQKKVNVHTKLSNLAFRTFKEIVNSHNTAIESVWNNPQGLTPEEVVLALGTDAAELFALTYALRTFIDNVQPGLITFTMPKAVTLNPDGTVTLSDL